MNPTSIPGVWTVVSPVALESIGIPLATITFGPPLLGSLSALAHANVRAVRHRG